ncbi:MAG: ABC transporter ATP-binding protein [Euryarchaeota archaeon]
MRLREALRVRQASAIIDEKGLVQAAVSMKDDVCVHDLKKDFGIFKAVNKLSLRVKHGEIYGLLGPNGAGKTTVIKMLCGLLRPSSGEAYVLDVKLPDPGVATHIGYMPQELALYLGLTVHENLAFYGEVFGLNKRQIDAREQELLRLVDLEASRDTLIDQLSGGMQHRISLACTLLHEPQLLFLDEPTVGVDPDLRASFWRYFEGLRDAGITILVTTHYMDEARHCDRIGFMREGRLIAEGAPRELLELTHTDSLEDAFLAYSRTEGPR